MKVSKQAERYANIHYADFERILYYAIIRWDVIIYATPSGSSKIKYNKYHDVKKHSQQLQADQHRRFS